LLKTFTRPSAVIDSSSFIHDIVGEVNKVVVLGVIEVFPLFFTYFLLKECSGSQALFQRQAVYILYLVLLLVFLEQKLVVT